MNPRRLSGRPRLPVVIVAICTLLPCAARAEFQTPIAITGATVVVEPGLTLESATVVIADGRIVAAGADVTVPPDAERIDGAGLIIYAGFIDGQTHLGIPKKVRSEKARKRTEDENPDPRQGPLPATRLANRRGIRPQFRALELYAPEEDQLKSNRAAGFTTALIAPRDGLLSGTSDLINLSDAPIRQAVLASSVSMHASFDTGEDGRYPRTLLGDFAQLRQVLLDAGYYAKMKRYARRHPVTARRSPTDAALEAVQPLRARSQRIVFEADSENDIRRALNLTGEFGLVVSLSGAREAWKVVDRIKAEKVRLIVSLKFDDEPEYGKKDGDKKKSGKKKPVADPKPDAEPDEAAADKPAEPTEKKAAKAKGGEKKIYEPLKVRKERRRLWEEQVANIIRLHEAGVPFALRTRDFKKPAELLKNLRKVIERGLPEDAALAALTTTPAKWLGMEDQLGAVRRGRVANLTVMTKPLSDKKAKVKYVFIDGKRFEIDHDKKKDKGADKGDKPGEKKSGAATEDKAEEADEEPQEPAAEERQKEKDTGPTFESEIKADRIPKTQTGGNVLIRNATVMPVSSPNLDHASILIRHGKIEKIGQILDVPEGVTVIEAEGRFVLPGFVDCHSHLGISGVNESALAISAEVRIGDLIDPTSVGIYRAVAGGVTTHHVMHGSANPIGGQNAIVKTKYGRSADEMLIKDAPRTIKFALGENVTHANFAQARGKRFPNSRMGVEAVIRTALEAGKAYRAKWNEYQRLTNAGEDPVPPRRDLRLDALADVLSGNLTVHSHCYRSDEILRLLAVAEDYGFRIGTLQHVLEGYRIAPEIARHGCGASTFSNFWAYKVEAYGAIPHNAALMTDHGVNVSINSDSPNTIRYFGQEAAKCIKWGGLTENQALRLITLNPAMQLQIDDRVGSLEVGKDGDVAIFNGHPLNTFSKCVMTLIEGEVYFEDKRPAATEPAGTFTPPGEVDMAIPKTDHRAYAITGATVHPISSPAITNGTVVIVEDKIHAVGTEVTVPPGAGVIDGRGLHVYPGLIDAGGTLGVTEIGSLAATRDSSDIATFAPHLRTASAIHPHSRLIRIARTAGITTALVEPTAGGFRGRGGATIMGQSAVIHLDGWTAPEMLVLDSYAVHIRVPSLPPGLSEELRKRFKKETDKALRELNEFMEKAKHYAKVKALAAEDPEIKVDVDLVLEAMIPFVRKEKPVVFNASSYKHILDTLEFAEKYDLRCVLSAATGAWKLADTLAKKKIPVILGTPLSYPRGEFETWDGIYRCAGVLDRAGVRFCFASKSASGAYNLGTQAGMAVAHGLSAERAEYNLTLGAAKILGIDDRVGSLEPGKQADLIVTTHSPCQTVCRVTHMFINGDPIELTSMHTESYDKFRNRPDPHLPPAPPLVGPPNLTRR